MNAVRSLEIFGAQLVGLGLLIGYVLSRVLPPNEATVLARRPYASGLAISASIIFVYKFILFPRFFSPFRDLPATSGVTKGELVLESPRGATPLRWMKDNRDAQLIRIRNRIGLQVLLVSGPDAIRDILNTRVYDFEKSWGVRAFLARAIGWGLILVEAGEHKKQRKALVPAFNIRRIRELYDFMWSKTQILLDQMDLDIKKHPVGDKGFGLVEVGEWASKLTLDIIGPTAMGHDFDSLNSEENSVADAFLELLRPTTDRLAFFALHFIMPEYIVRRLPLKTNQTLDSIGSFLRDTCAKIVADKHRQLDAKEKTNDFDILAKIMETGEFTDSELIDQMLTFLAAGHETTASALTWVCYLCAKHPEIQTKLRKEIRDSIPSSADPVTWELLESMPYLNGVCEETQRLYPTVPATIREAVVDTTVAGRHIPKGTTFILVPYATNRHPNYWGDNANEIVPERWIDTLPDGTTRPNKNGGTTTNFAELTFLHGPRSCIGRDFAKAELRCAVAGVIGKYQIELENHAEPRVMGVITMKPEGGMYLRFKAVEGW